MENIISRMIEVDDRARKIAEEGDRLRENAVPLIEQETASLKEQYRAKAQDRIRKIDEEENNNARQKIETAKEQNEQHMEHLKKLYAQNKDAWRKKILGEILER